MSGGLKRLHMAVQLSWLEHSVHTRSVIGSNPITATSYISAKAVYINTSCFGVFTVYEVINGPVVKRLRHRPFTAVTRVRFSSGSPLKSARNSGCFFVFTELFISQKNIIISLLKLSTIIKHLTFAYSIDIMMVDKASRISG